jgi:hypothetical protein
MRNFEHTVNVLVKAYLDDTLQLCNCYACAVGNMVANSRKLRYNKKYANFCWDSDESAAWFNACYAGHGGSIDLANDQISSTGYTWNEIKMIEMAFESAYRKAPQADRSQFDDKLIFNGLIAVVDVLADIHGIDLTQKEEAKKLFVKVQN